MSIPKKAKHEAPEDEAIEPVVDPTVNPGNNYGSSPEMPPGTNFGTNQTVSPGSSGNQSEIEKNLKRMRKGAPA